MRFPFTVVVLAGLALGLSGMQSVGRCAVPTGASPETEAAFITVVTPSSSTRIPVVPGDDVAAWSAGAANFEKMDAGDGQPKKGVSAVLLHFPSLRYWHFTGVGYDGAVDVVLVGAGGKVLATFEQLSGPAVYAFPEKLAGCVYLQGGTVARLGVKKGHLIVAEGFVWSQGREAAEQAAAFERALHRLKKTKNKNDLQLYCLARFYTATDDYSAALTVLDKALKKNRAPGYILDKARLLLSMGRYKEAGAEFAYLLKSHPGYMETYNVLGDTMHMLGDAGFLISIMQSQTLDGPRRVPVGLALASFYIKAGHLAGADALLQGLETGTPTLGQDDRARVSRVRGDFLVRNGKPKQAAEQYVVFLSQFPSAPGAARLRLFVSRHQKSRAK